MKTLLKIAGPVLMLVGLLLAVRFPQPGGNPPTDAAAAHFFSALDLSSPHWRGGLVLMGAGMLCLFLQVFIKD